MSEYFGTTNCIVFEYMYLYCTVMCFTDHGVFLLAGMSAGAVGSFIGTPAEISLIRMTSDGR